MPAMPPQLLLLLLMLVPDYQVIAQTCKQNLLLNITGNKNQSLTDGSEMHAPYAPGQNCSWVLQAPVGKRAVLKFIRFNTKVGCANVTLYHGMESAEGEGEGEGASIAGKGFSQGYENRRLQHQKLAGPWSGRWSKGAELNSTYMSHTRFMVVEFVSSNSTECDIGAEMAVVEMHSSYVGGSYAKYASGSYQYIVGNAGNSSAANSTTSNSTASNSTASNSSLGWGFEALYWASNPPTPAPTPPRVPDDDTQRWDRIQEQEECPIGNSTNGPQGGAISGNDILRCCNITGGEKLQQCVLRLDAITVGETLEFFGLCCALGSWLLFCSQFQGGLIGRVLGRALRLFVLPEDEEIIIGSISVAMLGGKIFFRDIRYTTRNTQLRIVEAEFSIIWWKRKIRQDPHDAVNEGAGQQDRVQVQLNGVEYMMYNNSYVNDEMERLKQALGADSTSAPAANQDQAKVKTLNKSDYVPGKTPLFYELCPITTVKITTGVVYIGAPRLPTLLIVSFGRGDVQHYIRTKESTLAPQDLYRSYTDIKLKEACVRSIRNKDYVGEAVMLKRKEQLDRENIVDDAIHSFERMLKAAKGIGTGIKEVVHEEVLQRAGIGKTGKGTVSRNSAIPKADFATTLESNSLDDIAEVDDANAMVGTDGNDGEDAVSYGTTDEQKASGAGLGARAAYRWQTAGTRRKRAVHREPPILMTSLMRIKYVFDQPGLVDSDLDQESAASPWYKTFIELGDQQKLDSTFISFGPWADRQRKLFMQYFFPFNFQNRDLNAPKMGEERTPNDMEITIVTHHALTMQLPYVMTGLATKTSSFKNAAAHAVEESGLENVSVSDNVGKVQDDSVSDGADSSDDSSSDTPHDAWSGLKSKNSSPASSGDDTDDNDDDDDDAKHLGKTRQLKRESSWDNRKVHKREFDGPLGAASAIGGKCGWVEIDFAAGSEIKVAIPWTFVNPGGERQIVRATLKNARVQCSLTHTPFIQCRQNERLLIECCMHYPVGWNAPHEWSYTIDCGAAQMWFLRQHVSEFVDLVADWTAPVNPNEYQWYTLAYFIPVNYQYELIFTDLEWIFNANHHNVIDVPNAPERNTHMVLHLPCMTADISAPALQFEPPTTTIEWSVRFGGSQQSNSATDEVTTCTMSFCLPQNHSDAQIYGTISERTFCEFRQLTMEGRWEYYNKFAPTYVDMITMDIDFDGFQLEVTPQMIDVLCDVQDNYFGSYVYPIGSMEYKESDNCNLLNYLAMRRTYYDEKGGLNPFNECDISTNLTVRGGSLHMPIALGSPCGPSNTEDGSQSSGVVLSFYLFQLQTRNTDRLMDCNLGFSPITIYIPKPPHLNSNSATGGVGADDLLEEKLQLESITYHWRTHYGKAHIRPKYNEIEQYRFGRLSGQLRLPQLQTLTQAFQVYTEARSYTYARLAEQNDANSAAVDVVRATGLPTMPYDTKTRVFVELHHQGRIWRTRSVNNRNAPSATLNSYFQDVRIQSKDSPLMMKVYYELPWERCVLVGSGVVGLGEIAAENGTNAYVCDIKIDNPGYWVQRRSKTPVKLHLKLALKPPVSESKWRMQSHQNIARANDVCDDDNVKQDLALVHKSRNLALSKLDLQLVAPDVLILSDSGAQAVHLQGESLLHLVRDASTITALYSAKMVLDFKFSICFFSAKQNHASSQLNVEGLPFDGTYSKVGSMSAHVELIKFTRNDKCNFNAEQQLEFIKEHSDATRTGAHDFAAAVTQPIFSDPAEHHMQQTAAYNSAIRAVVESPFAHGTLYRFVADAGQWQRETVEARDGLLRCTSGKETMLEVTLSEIRDIEQHNDALNRFEIRHHGDGLENIIRLAANSGLSALIWVTKLRALTTDHILDMPKQSVRRERTLSQWERDRSKELMRQQQGNETHSTRMSDISTGANPGYNDFNNPLEESASQLVFAGDRIHLTVDQMDAIVEAAQAEDSQLQWHAFVGGHFSGAAMATWLQEAHTRGDRDTAKRISQQMLVQGALLVVSAGSDVEFEDRANWFYRFRAGTTNSSKELPVEKGEVPAIANKKPKSKWLIAKNLVLASLSRGKSARGSVPATSIDQNAHATISNGRKIRRLSSEITPEKVSNTAQGDAKRRPRRRSSWTSESGSRRGSIDEGSTVAELEQIKADLPDPRARARMHGRTRRFSMSGREIKTGTQQDALQSSIEAKPALGPRRCSADYQRSTARGDVMHNRLRRNSSALDAWRNDAKGRTVSLDSVATDRSDVRRTSAPTQPDGLIKWNGNIPLQSSSMRTHRARRRSSLPNILPVTHASMAANNYETSSADASDAASSPCSSDGFYSADDHGCISGSESDFYSGDDGAGGLLDRPSLPQQADMSATPITAAYSVGPSNAYSTDQVPLTMEAGGMTGAAPARPHLVRNASKDTLRRQMTEEEHLERHDPERHPSVVGMPQSVTSKLFMTKQLTKKGKIGSSFADRKQESSIGIPRGGVATRSAQKVTDAAAILALKRKIRDAMASLPSQGRSSAKNRVNVAAGQLHPMVEHYTMVDEEFRDEGEALIGMGASHIVMHLPEPTWESWRHFHSTTMTDSGMALTYALCPWPFMRKHDNANSNKDIAFKAIDGQNTDNRDLFATSDESSFTGDDNAGPSTVPTAEILTTQLKVPDVKLVMTQDLIECISDSAAELEQASSSLSWILDCFQFWEIARMAPLTQVVEHPSSCSCRDSQFELSRVHIQLLHSAKDSQDVLSHYSSDLTFHSLRLTSRQKQPHEMLSNGVQPLPNVEANECRDAPDGTTQTSGLDAKTSDEQTSEGGVARQGLLDTLGERMAQSVRPVSGIGKARSMLGRDTKHRYKRSNSLGRTGGFKTWTLAGLARKVAPNMSGDGDQASHDVVKVDKVTTVPPTRVARRQSTIDMGDVKAHIDGQTETGGTDEAANAQARASGAKERRLSNPERRSSTVISMAEALGAEHVHDTTEHLLESEIPMSNRRHSSNAADTMLHSNEDADDAVDESKDPINESSTHSTQTQAHAAIPVQQTEVISEHSYSLHAHAVQFGVRLIHTQTGNVKASDGVPAQVRNAGHVIHPNTDCVLFSAQIACSRLISTSRVHGRRGRLPFLNTAWSRRAQDKWFNKKKHKAFRGSISQAVCACVPKAFPAVRSLMRTCSSMQQHFEERLIVSPQQRAIYRWHEASRLIWEHLIAMQKKAKVATARRKNGQRHSFFPIRRSMAAFQSSVRSEYMAQRRRQIEQPQRSAAYVVSTQAMDAPDSQPLFVADTAGWPLLVRLRQAMISLGPERMQAMNQVLCALPSLQTPVSEPWWKGDDFLLQSDMTSSTWAKNYKEECRAAVSNDGLWANQAQSPDKVHKRRDISTESHVSFALEETEIQVFEPITQTLSSTNHKLLLHCLVNGQRLAVHTSQVADKPVHIHDDNVSQSTGVGDKVSQSPGVDAMPRRGSKGRRATVAISSVKQRTAIKRRTRGKRASMEDISALPPISTVRPHSQTSADLHDENIFETNLQAIVAGDDQNEKLDVAHDKISFDHIVDSDSDMDHEHNSIHPHEETNTASHDPDAVSEVTFTIDYDSIQVTAVPEACSLAQSFADQQSETVKIQGDADGEESRRESKIEEFWQSRHDFENVQSAPAEAMDTYLQSTQVDSEMEAPLHKSDMESSQTSQDLSLSSRKPRRQPSFGTPTDIRGRNIFPLTATQREAQERLSFSAPASGSAQTVLATPTPEKSLPEKQSAAMTSMHKSPALTYQGIINAQSMDINFVVPMVGVANVHFNGIKSCSCSMGHSVASNLHAKSFGDSVCGDDRANVYQSRGRAKSLQFLSLAVSRSSVALYVSNTVPAPAVRTPAYRNLKSMVFHAYCNHLTSYRAAGKFEASPLTHIRFFAHANDIRSDYEQHKLDPVLTQRMHTFLHIWRVWVQWLATARNTKQMSDSSLSMANAGQADVSDDKQQEQMGIVLLTDLASSVAVSSEASVTYELDSFASAIRVSDNGEAEAVNKIGTHKLSFIDARMIQLPVIFVHSIVPSGDGADVPVFVYVGTLKSQFNPLMVEQALQMLISMQSEMSKFFRVAAEYVEQRTSEGIGLQQLGSIDGSRSPSDPSARRFIFDFMLETMVLEAELKHDDGTDSSVELSSGQIQFKIEPHEQYAASQAKSTSSWLVRLAGIGILLRHHDARAMSRMTTLCRATSQITVKNEIIDAGSKSMQQDETYMTKIENTRILMRCRAVRILTEMSERYSQSVSAAMQKATSEADDENIDAMQQSAESMMKHVSDPLSTKGEALLTRLRQSKAIARLNIAIRNTSVLFPFTVCDLQATSNREDQVSSPRRSSLKLLQVPRESAWLLRLKSLDIAARSENIISNYAQAIRSITDVSVAEDNAEQISVGTNVGKWAAKAKKWMRRASIVDTGKKNDVRGRVVVSNVEIIPVPLGANLCDALCDPVSTEPQHTSTDMPLPSWHCKCAHSPPNFGRLPKLEAFFYVESSTEATDLRVRQIKACVEAVVEGPVLNMDPTIVGHAVGIRREWLQTLDHETESAEADVPAAHSRQAQEVPSVSADAGQSSTGLVAVVDVHALLKEGEVNLFASAAGDGKRGPQTNRMGRVFSTLSSIGDADDRVKMFRLPLPRMAYLSSMRLGGVPIATSSMISSTRARESTTSRTNATHVELQMEDVELSPTVIVFFQQLVRELHAYDDTELVETRRRQRRYARLKNKNKKVQARRTQAMAGTFHDKSAGDAQDRDQQQQDTGPPTITIVNLKPVKVTVSAILGAGSDQPSSIASSCVADFADGLQLCHSSGTMEKEGIEMVMLDSTTLSIPTLVVQLTENAQQEQERQWRHQHQRQQYRGRGEGRPIAQMSFDTISAHLNTAVGLRPDREAFSTLLGDVISVQLQCQASELEKVMILQKAWALKVADAQHDMEVAQHGMQNADVEPATPTPVLSSVKAEDAPALLQLPEPALPLRDRSTSRTRGPPAVPSLFTRMQLRSFSIEADLTPANDMHHTIFMLRANPLTVHIAEPGRMRDVIDVGDREDWQLFFHLGWLEMDCSGRLPLQIMSRGAFVHGQREYGVKVEEQKPALNRWILVLNDEDYEEPGMGRKRWHGVARTGMMPPKTSIFADIDCSHDHNDQNIAGITPAKLTFRMGHACVEAWEKLANDTGPCNVDVVIDLAYVHCNVTSETQPHVEDFMQRLRSLLSDQREEAARFVEHWRLQDSHFSDNRGAVTQPLSVQVAPQPVPVKSSHAPPRGLLRGKPFRDLRHAESMHGPDRSTALRRMPTVRAGDLQIRVHDLKLQLHGDDAEGGDLMIETTVLRMHLWRSIPDEQPGDRAAASRHGQLLLKRLQYVDWQHLGIAKQTHVRRGRRGGGELSSTRDGAAASSSSAGMFANVRGGSGRKARMRRGNIFIVPPSSWKMTTHQYVGFTRAGDVEQKPELYFVFDANFYDKKIVVSTDFQDYKFLKATFGDFAQGDEAPHSIAAAGAGSGGRPQREFVLDETWARKHGVEAFVFKPKLSVMGEATPDAEWVLKMLGVRQELIPQSCHEGVTDSLDALLTALCNASAAIDTRFEQTDFGIGAKPSNGFTDDSQTT